ncbi:hypothetical protein AeRB84_018315 [Aphanomyces euteiches]|nr:hypothetical protein AeRB84_018315 [Aphanomyces euteiches]
MGRRDLTNEEREAILREVFLRSTNGCMARLPKGFGRELAVKYNCNVSTIRRILARAKDQGVLEGNMFVSVASMKKGRVGRKKAYTAEQVLAKIHEIPVEDRTTLRIIAEKSGISLATLHKYLQEGVFRAHSSAIRPHLTNANKYNRMKFAMSFVKPTLSSTMMMNDLMEYVHLDEKWFYLTKDNRKYYLVPGEKEPQRKCQSQRFITKVMFLCAVARPRYSDDSGSWWDGKLGIWPFVESVEARRDSANRVAGNYETKCLQVTKDVYRTFLIDEVLPAIVSKWPTPKQVIKLQHDNARPHVGTTDPILAAVFRDYQSLGLFASIQSLQHRKSAKTIDDLVANVKLAFDELSYEKLDHTFLTLQTCMIETMKLFGDNTYKIPHVGKNKLARKGLLPQNFPCNKAIFDACLEQEAALDGPRLEKEFDMELEDAKPAAMLARELERVSLGDQGGEDIASALENLGIEVIELE